MNFLNVVHSEHRKRQKKALMCIDLKIPGRKYWMNTHVIFPLISLNSTSFITKLVFRIAFADGVGRVPTNGDGASGKNIYCYDNR